MSFAHLLLLALAASEAQPKLVDRVLDERVETRRTDIPLAPSLRVTVAGEEIVGTLARERECVADRVRVRHVGSYLPRPWGLPVGIGLAAVGGGLLLAAGGLVVVAPNQPSINDPFSRGELSREAAGTLAAVSGVAGTAGAASGILVALFVGDELLSERTDEDKIGSRFIDCAALPLAGVPVWLVVQGSAPIVATTDDGGRVAWPVPETPPLPSSRAWARLEADAGEHEPLTVVVELPATAFLKTLADADLAGFRQFAAVFPDFALPPQLEWRRLDLARAAEATARSVATEKADREAANSARAAADLEKRRAAATAAWSGAKPKTAAVLKEIAERFGADAIPEGATAAVEKVEAEQEARVARLVESSHARAARGDIKGALAAIAEAAELDPNVNMTPRAVLLGDLGQPPERLLSLFSQDVFAYFGLNDRFPTELEQRAYQKTAEYREKKAELAALYAQASRKRNFITPDLKLGTYSVKDGAFLVDTGHANLANGLAWVQPPRTFNKVLYFPKLPVRMGGLPTHLVEPGGPEWEKLVIRVPEEKALEIERVRQTARIVLIFTPKAATRTPPFRVFSIDRWYEMTPQVVRCDLHAIAVVDDASGAVLHVQTF